MPFISVLSPIDEFAPKEGTSLLRPPRPPAPDHVFGLVLYVGAETKVMKNVHPDLTKRSTTPGGPPRPGFRCWVTICSRTQPPRSPQSTVLCIPGYGSRVGPSGCFFNPPHARREIGASHWYRISSNSQYPKGSQSLPHTHQLTMTGCRHPVPGVGPVPPVDLRHPRHYGQAPGPGPGATPIFAVGCRSRFLKCAPCFCYILWPFQVLGFPKCNEWIKCSPSGFPGAFVSLCTWSATLFPLQLFARATGCDCRRDICL